MKLKRTKLAMPTIAYLEQAKKIAKKDAERLMARMKGRLTRRLEDKTFSQIEILALQLQYEDEQLKEWRKNMKKLREKNSA
jgi:Holliday junction resolvasome RuvABC DNA-binding subunit